MSLALTEDSAPNPARVRADRIIRHLRAASDEVQGRLAEAVAEIRSAFESADYLELGFRSPSDYVSTEFGTVLRDLPLDVRRSVVPEFRALGLSSRAIASVLDVNQMYVVRSSPVQLKQNVSVEPRPVVAIDGKDRSGAIRERARREILADPDAAAVDLAERADVSVSTINRVRVALRDDRPAPLVRLDRATRVAQIAEHARRGLTSSQIGAEIGLGVQRVRALARAAGIAIPADVVMHHTKKPDSTQVANRTVTALEGLALGIRLIDYDDIDPQEAAHWVDSLADSLRALNRFSKRIKESTQ